MDEQKQKQRVVLDVFSPISLQAGVLQDSVLFLIYITDLCNYLENKLYHFVNGSTLCKRLHQSCERLDDAEALS